MWKISACLLVVALLCLLDLQTVAGQAVTEPTCPGKLVFSDCPHTCEDFNDDCSTTTTLPACVCRNRTYLFREKCVRKSQCKCIDDMDNNQDVLRSWLSTDCKTEFTCQKVFFVSQRTHNCPPQEKCVSSGGYGKCIPEITSNECNDTVTKDNPMEILSSNKVYLETATSCERIVGCHPKQCKTLGGPGGACCASCHAVGDAECMNSVSHCFPYRFTGKDGERSSLDNCYQLLKSFPEMCDKVGGPGKRCCKACKEGLPKTKDVMCVNSYTTKVAKGERTTSCSRIAQTSFKLDRCCTKNMKGYETPLKCRQICCGSCGPF